MVVFVETKRDLVPRHRGPDWLGRAFGHTSLSLTLTWSFLVVVVVDGDDDVDLDDPR